MGWALVFSSKEESWRQREEKCDTLLSGGVPVLVLAASTEMGRSSHAIYSQALRVYWKTLVSFQDKEAQVIGTFKNGQLYIELRPRCPKCKKEFMLDIRKFLPGKAHSCYACGTISGFDAQLAERIQKLVRDLDESISEIYESFSLQKAD